MNTSESIRSVGPEDEEALASLFTELAADPEARANFHPHPLDPETATRIASYVGKDVYLGAFGPGGMHGYAMLRGWDEGYSVPSFGVAVAPAHRGQDVGSRLLDECLRLARCRGASSIMLKVHPDNERALAWYRAEGFRPTGRSSDGQLICSLDLATWNTYRLPAEAAEGESVRVLFALGAGWGGPRSTAIDLLRAALRAGDDPVLLVPEEDELVGEARVLGVPFVVYGRFFGHSYELWKAWRLARIIRGARPEVIFSYYMFPVSFLVRLAGFLAGVPVVSQVATELAWNQHAAIAVYQRMLYRMGARFPGMFVAASRRSREQLLRLGLPAHRVRLIHTGIDVDQVAAARSERLPADVEAAVLGHRVVACIGSLDRNKSQLHAIEAFADASLPDDIHLAIVGKESEQGYERALRAKAEDLGLSARVSFLGHRDRRTVWALLHRVDVLLQLSEHEGLPVVVLEAQAAGVPVIGTLAGGIPDIVVDGVTGFLVRHGDTALVAGHLRRLLRDERMRREMSECAARRARTRFSVAPYYDALRETYKEVVRRKATARR